MWSAPGPAGSGARLLESAGRRGAEAFRFLHVSTDEVYGSLGETGKFTETTPYAPNSPYSASKAASDHLVRAFHHTYGLPVLTTNCSNNYGPYQFPEKLIPLMIAKRAGRRAAAGLWRRQEGARLAVRGDHCAAIRTVLAAGRVGEVYNVGGDAERENIEVVNTDLRAAGPARPRSRRQPRANR
jgi:dTDP-glucose 4,6-dehydratase